MIAPGLIKIQFITGYAVLIAPDLIKNTVYNGVCCFDSPWFNKIQFITGYAVLIAPDLIKIQFIKGYAVLIAPDLIKNTVL